MQQLPPQDRDARFPAAHAAATAVAATEVAQQAQRRAPATWKRRVAGCEALGFVDEKQIHREPST